MTVHVNEAQDRMFPKKITPDAIPPRHAGHEQQIKRAAYQGRHIWGHIWWQTSDAGLYEPNWTSLPEASKACYELIYAVVARRVAMTNTTAKKLL